jgi:hypothetical protein
VGVGEGHHSLAGTAVSSHGMVARGALCAVVDGAPATSSSFSGSADGFDLKL